MEKTARLAPLPYDMHADLKEGFEATLKRMGFQPNSMLILQRRPHILKAFRALTMAINGPDSLLDPALRALVTLACSSVSRVPYVLAHAAHSVAHAGQEAKLAAFEQYRTSPLFSAQERVTIDYARAAAMLPNGVTDELLLEMRKHWSEEEIVEITALIALYGFFDRWNGSMATPLEDEPRQVAEKHLAPRGWTPGRHASY